MTLAQDRGQFGDGAREDDVADDCPPADLLWTLAHYIDPLLTGPRRDAVYVAIGAGDGIGAMTVLMSLMLEHHVALPSAIINGIHRWLDGYLGTDREPLLRAAISRWTLRSSPPLRTAPDCWASVAERAAGDVEGVSAGNFGTTDCR